MLFQSLSKEIFAFIDFFAFRVCYSICVIEALFCVGKWRKRRGWGKRRLGVSTRYGGTARR
jgi:hypothetical protein